MLSRRLLVVAVTMGLITAGLLYQLPQIAAGGLLYPSRRNVTDSPPASCENHEISSSGLKLFGWRCSATAAPRRGTIVYLHGIADNKSSSAGVIRRYVPRGFDVLAYDSRRHGESDGEVCTYGFHEKHDLRRIVDSAADGPIVLFGTSLGAAIAFQEAPDDPRVSLIVAAEVFSDLRTVALERAPFILPTPVINRAFEIAEERGAFKIEEVSPRAAARRIRVPVLLIHGAEDRDTPPAHSRRVLDALSGRKRLLLVDGVGHNHSLSKSAVWDVIDRWIETMGGEDQ